MAKLTPEQEIAYRIQQVADLRRRAEEATAELARIAQKNAEGTLHVFTCNADHNKPVGCEGCSCPPGRLVKAALRARDEARAEVERLVARWRAEAQERRDESSRIRSVVKVQTDAEERCLIRAETLDRCAKELAALRLAPNPPPASTESNAPTKGETPDAK